MQISRFRNRVAFWSKATAVNPDGTRDTRWKEKFPAWAEVISIGGEEGRLAAATSSSIKFRLTMRYRRDLDPAMMVQLLDEGRFLTVQAIRDPDGRKDIVELSCEWKQGQIEPS